MKRHRRKTWCGRIGLWMMLGAFFLQTLFGDMTLTAQAEPDQGIKMEIREQQSAEGDLLAKMAEDRDIMGLVYLCQEYSLKVEPRADAETAGSVSCGQTVNALYAATDGEGQLWLKVCSQSGAAEAEGWMEREHFACSDERFLEWEAAYGFAKQTYSQLMAAGRDMETQVGEGVLREPEIPAIPEDILQFPESYREPLIALKQTHPNWIFVPMATGLDWTTAITAELQGAKSLVHKSLPDCTKEDVYDQGDWYYASREVLERYMDPRNGLTEDAIFQFEQLTYNASYHTQEALSAFLEKTFMNSSRFAPGTEMHFDLIIYAIGKWDQVNVSPFHLAARIYQEQGQGTSPLISGTYPGYEGYYNYFNIGASGTTRQQIIENGLKYAKNRGWSSAYYSIEGGAKFLSGNYISKGQDTLYLQKYNVNPNSSYKIYSHQYMQNISAPTTEARSIRNLYDSAGALNSPFVFKIPLYDNMPATPCAMPTASTNVVLQIPSGYTGTQVLIDGVETLAEKRNGRLIATAPDGNAKRASIQIRDSQGKVTKTYNWDLSYSNQCYKAVAWPTAITPTSIFLPIPEGYTDTTVWVDGVNYSGTVYQGQLIAQAPYTSGKTAVMYQYNESGVPVDMYVWTLDYQGESYTATAQPGLQGLLSYHGFAIRITGKSGIRFKSGISVETRNRLLGEGVAGYRLKEYGTLVMADTNRKTYPMVKGGEKVQAGVSYGVQADGTVTDTIYETVEGRHRFTSVLVGLPAEQYKTEFAFRGYAVLEKDGREIVVYGPAVARSIYSLSQQALGVGLYQEGSEADLFLRQLIRDADALNQ